MNLSLVLAHIGGLSIIIYTICFMLAGILAYKSFVYSLTATLVQGSGKMRQIKSFKDVNKEMRHSLLNSRAERKIYNDTHKELYASTYKKIYQRFSYESFYNLFDRVEHLEGKVFK